MDEVLRKNLLRDGTVDVKGALLSIVGDEEVVSRLLSAFGENVFGRSAKSLKRKAKIPADVADRIVSAGESLAKYFCSEYLDSGWRLSERMLRQMGILHRDSSGAGTIVKTMNDMCFLVNKLPPERALHEYYKTVLLLFYPARAAINISRVIRNLDFRSIFTTGRVPPTKYLGEDGATALSRATMLLKSTPLGVFLNRYFEQSHKEQQQASLPDTK